MTRIALKSPISESEIRVPDVQAPRAYTAKDAAVLNWRFGNLTAERLLWVAAKHLFPGRLAVVTSFGADSAIVLDMVSRIDRHLPVIFLETGKHFPETLEYRDRLAARLGLTDVRSISPLTEDIAREDEAGDLWQRDPDRCCELRKVLPLERALRGFDAWVTGRKRFQAGTRSSLEAIDAGDGRIKFNPLHDWDYGDIRRAFEDRDLPDHPLLEYGYLSVGCMPCTQSVKPGEDIRAGRWAHVAKTECGIHRDG